MSNDSGATTPVITVRGLADYLRVHPTTVYRLAKRGVLPAFKVGADWRFNREDIDRWRLAQSDAESYNSMVTAADKARDERARGAVRGPNGRGR